MAAANDGRDIATEAELNRMQLNETLRFYEAEGDFTEIEKVNRTPPTIDWAGLNNDLAAFDGIENVERQSIRSNVVTEYLLKTKKAPKETQIRKIEDNVENISVAHFNLVHTATTVDNLLGGENGRFATFRFNSDYERALMKKELLESALRQTYELAGNEVANHEVLNNNKRTLRRAIHDAMDTLNLTKLYHAHEKKIVQKTKDDMIRKNTITSSLGPNFIPPPEYGTHDFLEANEIKVANQLIGHIPFGSTSCTRDLASYLTDVKGIGNSRLSEVGFYKLMSKITVNEPRRSVENHRLAKTSFDHLWLFLQVSYGSKSGHEDYASQINKILTTRPTNIKMSIATLENICQERNKNLPDSERDIVANSQLKNCVFTLLQKWHPTQATLIRKAFTEIVENAADPKTLMPPAILLTMLTQEYVKTAPISQKAAEMYALDIVGAEASTEMLSAEADKILASQAKANMEGSEEADMNAMFNTGAYPKNGARGRGNGRGGRSFRGRGRGGYQNRGYQNQGYQNNQGSQDQGLTYKGIKIQDWLRGKCLKCKKEGHGENQCLTFKLPLSTEACLYCRAYHNKQERCFPASQYEFSSQEKKD